MRISDWSSDVCSSDLTSTHQGLITNDAVEAGARSQKYFRKLQGPMEHTPFRLTILHFRLEPDLRPVRQLADLVDATIHRFPDVNGKCGSVYALSAVRQN